MKVVFLDRDGTINVDHGYVHRREDWEFTEHAVDALRLLRDAGFQLTIVSNQSGIASGRYTADHVLRLHAWAGRLLCESGVAIAAWAFCPHAASAACGCRKPKTGLVLEIVRQLGEPIDYEASWTIGDKESDVLFGESLGTRTVLLSSRYWEPEDVCCRPTHIAHTLRAAAIHIVGNGG